MKFLIFFLFPLVFSAKFDYLSELRSLKNYGEGNEDPLGCADKAEKAIGGLYCRNTPLTTEQINNSKSFIRNCVLDIGRRNKKVNEVEFSLIDIIFEYFKFYNVDYFLCRKKFETRTFWDNLEDKSCWNSSQILSFEDNAKCQCGFGTNGCMIDLWKKECGEDLVENIFKFGSFDVIDQQNCFDEYSDKYNIIPKELSVKQDPSSEIGYLEDYIGQNETHNPLKCFDKAHGIAVKALFEENPRTAEKLEPAKVFLKNCVNEVSKINKKVDDDKDAFTKNIVEALHFLEIDFHSCEYKQQHRKSWENLEDESCWYSKYGISINPALTSDKYRYRKITNTNPESPCQSVWGKDGCMIDLWKKECGEDFVKGYAKFAPFLEKEEQTCVNLYSQKLNF
ncbi:unnamed protein product [Caenorhabditis angaria]|uniref:T20D4.11-like domain-containing protein n=1 Tax=Caenorhabditis angaria TaxID=860376 RepID=A0A9P1N8W3_9PELO|nr:unnamed protein product [Caenorhabditis angaria]